MKAFAPVIGAKPSSGVLLGAAGNVAFYRGEPSTTHISSAVASLTFSTKGQTALTDRFTMFGRDDRWRLDGDQRFQWTSLETHALGTSADTRAGVEADFDFFRLHHTALLPTAAGLFAGAGLYFDNHTNVGPAEGAEAGWADVAVRAVQRGTRPAARHAGLGGRQRRPAVGHARQLHQRRRAAGSRRSVTGRCSTASSAATRAGRRSISTCEPTASSRATAATRSPSGRSPIWSSAARRRTWTCPATGLDTYGRSARGYSEGQFRGERLAYGEIEYRGTLTRNGLLGMVAFLNTTTVTTAWTASTCSTASRPAAAPDSVC